MEKIVFDVDPYSFTGSAVLVGLILVNEFSNEEQDSVGNWLQLVGLVMQTYASQASTIKSNQDTTNSSNDNHDIDTIKKAIEKINDKLEELKKKCS